MVLKIGLTGGIGSGKSTACKLFSELGVPVIDADVIAHNIVKPGMPALQLIKDEYGDDIITADGYLDRGKLRDQIFTNDNARKKLENILHLIIYENIAREVRNIKSKYCIISIPLLLETGADESVDRILVIDVPEELQILRASHRDEVTRNNIKAIIRSQISRDERLIAADDIVNNEGDVENLRRQLHQLHEFYTSI